MSGSRSDYLEAAEANLIYGATALVAPVNIYVALFLATPLDDGTGGTEVSLGNYARTAVLNNVANWPVWAAGNKHNGAAVVFPVCAVAAWAPVSGSPTAIVAWGTYDALVLGNLLHYAEFISTEYAFTASAATDFLTAPGHALTNGMQVRVTTLPALGSLPTGIADRTTYFVVGVAGSTLQLSLTSGGAAINLTADGVGKIGQIFPKFVDIGDQLTLPITTGIVILTD